MCHCLVAREFQSTLPRREATSSNRTHNRAFEFQSTLPRREATTNMRILGTRKYISIHASPKGSDHGYAAIAYMQFYFNPRFPEGKRRRTGKLLHVHHAISIHASPKGSDTVTNHVVQNYDIFQSTLPRREATWRCFSWLTITSYFNPRFPEGKRRT